MEHMDSCVELSEGWKSFKAHNMLKDLEMAEALQAAALKAWKNSKVAAEALEAEASKVWETSRTALETLDVSVKSSEGWKSFKAYETGKDLEMVEALKAWETSKADLKTFEIRNGIQPTDSNQSTNIVRPTRASQDDTDERMKSLNEEQRAAVRTKERAQDELTGVQNQILSHVVVVSESLAELIHNTAAAGEIVTTERLLYLLEANKHATCFWNC
jgi:ribosomal protein L9